MLHRTRRHRADAPPPCLGVDTGHDTDVPSPVRTQVAVTSDTRTWTPGWTWTAQAGDCSCMDHWDDWTQGAL